MFWILVAFSDAVPMSSTTAPSPKCICFHGVAAEDDECNFQQRQHCVSCNETVYFLDAATRSCVKKICTCRNGEPAVGEACPNNGDLLCVSCDVGLSIRGVECPSKEDVKLLEQIAGLALLLSLIIGFAVVYLRYFRKEEEKPRLPVGEEVARPRWRNFRRGGRNVEVGQESVPRTVARRVSVRRSVSSAESDLPSPSTLESRRPLTAAGDVRRTLMVTAGRDNKRKRGVEEQRVRQLAGEMPPSDNVVAHTLRRMPDSNWFTQFDQFYNARPTNMSENDAATDGDMA